MSSSDEESVVSNEEVSQEESSEEEEVVVAKPVKAKRVRKGKNGKRKDPLKPKRNMSAFFLFSNANRAILKAANPELSFGDLAKLISTKFKALDENERKKWDKKAAKDKIRYLEVMKDYVAPIYSDSEDDSDDNEGKKKKKKAKKSQRSQQTQT